MLLEFTVKNFLSFKDEAIFSLYASTEESRHPNNLIPFKNGAVLKSAAIYGANAAGKSNLIKAMGFMRRTVLKSIKLNPEELIIPVGNYPSFRLNTTTRDEPLEMEISFVDESNDYYRYGFRLDSHRIHDEWLYLSSLKDDSIGEECFFEREKGVYAPIFNGLDRGSIPENTLLLAWFGKFVDSPARKAMAWFQNKLNVIDSLDEESYEGFTYQKLDEDDYHPKILEFLKAADLNIDYVRARSVDSDILSSKLPKRFPQNLRDMIARSPAKEIVFRHNVYDQENQVVFSEEWGEGRESAGTQKLFALSGPLIEILRKGEIFIIDEMDAKLHPVMMRFILNLFHYDNPYGAQLIFATHNTDLLSERFFRLDQVWMVRKDAYGSSEIYPISDFGELEDRDMRADYMAGLYEAVPLIKEFTVHSPDKENAPVASSTRSI